MLQDIAPNKFWVDYNDYKPRFGDICLLFESDSVYCKYVSNTLTLPTYGMLHSQVTGATRYLFAINDTRYFLVTDVTPSIYGYRFEKVRALRNSQPQNNTFALMTAYHLYNWYVTNLFCGKCGARTEHDSALRAIICPHCGNQIFPRISPAVIVAVTYGDSILLTKYRDRPYQGPALVAGFVEIGETVEDAIRREVMEETGLTLGRLKFYKSQPWGIDGGLLLGFFANLKGSPSIKLQEDELSYAGWYSRASLENFTDNGVSLTGEMISQFKDGYGG